jgi:hypothetical protein
MDGLLEARWNTLSWLLQDTPCSPTGEFYSGVFGEFTTDTNSRRQHSQKISHGLFAGGMLAI